MIVEINSETNIGRALEDIANELESRAGTFAELSAGLALVKLAARYYTVPIGAQEVRRNLSEIWHKFAAYVNPATETITSFKAL